MQRGDKGPGRGRRIGGGGGEGALGEGGYKSGEKDRKSGRGGRGMALVKLAGREEKRKVMEARRKLTDGKVRIEDDLTEEERRGRWKIETEAESERERGKNVQIGYMKMWVNGNLRRWDEVGEKWLEEQGNGKGGRVEGERG